jgi:ribosome-associated toxin RatA of RatAB toxin-antitoxin module
MREVRRTALVPYTPAQMYAIANDVRRYPEFVPWCSRTEVHEETEQTIDATVEIARAGVRVAVRTRNTMVPGERIDLRLVEGPLRTLEGAWVFTPIVERASPFADLALPGPVSPPAAAASSDGLPATPRVRGCRVDLDIRFEFRNAALTLLFGPVFEQSWDSLVDVFVERARVLHGGAGK